MPAAPQLGVTPGFKVLDADQSDKLMRRAVREVEQLQQQAAGGGGGGGGGGSGAVSGAGDSSASSNSSNSRNGSSSSGDGSSSSSSRPLPVALPALPADELTSRAVAILGERLSDLIPDLKMRLAAAAPTVPEGRELDAATRLPAAEPGQARAQAALPPAAPEASRVARGVDDKAAGDKRAVAARWHRKQVQAYLCMYQRWAPGPGRLWHREGVREGCVCAGTQIVRLSGSCRVMSHKYHITAPTIETALPTQAPTPLTSPRSPAPPTTLSGCFASTTPLTSPT